MERPLKFAAAHKPPLPEVVELREPIEKGGNYVTMLVFFNISPIVSSYQLYLGDVLPLKINYEMSHIDSVDGRNYVFRKFYNGLNFWSFGGIGSEKRKRRRFLTQRQTC